MTPMAQGSEPWMPNGFPPPSFVVETERIRTFAGADANFRFFRDLTFNVAVAKIIERGLRYRRNGERPNRCLIFSRVSRCDGELGMQMGGGAGWPPPPSWASSCSSPGCC